MSPVPGQELAGRLGRPVSEGASGRGGPSPPGASSGDGRADSPAIVTAVCSPAAGSAAGASTAGSAAVRVARHRLVARAHLAAFFSVATVVTASSLAAGLPRR